MSQSANVSDFCSGHDLTVREFEPRVGLCADSSEPGACFGFCALCLSVSLSLSLSAPPPTHTLSLSVSKINRGAWVAQSVKHLTLAQVTILWLRGSSPVLWALC